MRRLTTPTHTFTFPLDVDEYQEILLTYVQNNKIILNKSKKNGDFTFNENVGSVTLTQEDTALFTSTDSDNCCSTKATLVEIQIRAIDNDGRAFASDIWKRPVRRVLNDEVLA